MEGEITLTKRETEFAEVREGTGVQGWGGGWWEGKELQRRGRELAAWAGGEAAETSREKMHHSDLEEIRFP